MCGLLLDWRLSLFVVRRALSLVVVCCCGTLMIVVDRFVLCVVWCYLFFLCVVGFALVVV